MNTYRVRHQRKQLGLMQSDMAKTLGISKGTYSKKENGFLKFSLEEAHQLSKFFNMSIEDLFFDDKHPILT